MLSSVLTTKFVDNAKEFLRSGALLTSFLRHGRSKRTRPNDVLPVIAYDGTLLTHAVNGIPNITGIERYLMELAVRVAHEKHFSVRIYSPLEFASPGLTASFGPEEHIVCGSALQWMRQLGASLGRGEIDIYHLHEPAVLPSQLLPIRLAPRSVVTIHDLIPLHFGYKSPYEARTYRRRLRHVARSADALIFNSEFTRQDFTKLVGKPRGITRVTHLGVGEQFRPTEDSLTIDRVRAKYQLPDLFILALGRAAPHKNIPALVRAVALLRSRGSDVKLVLAGPRDNAAGQGQLDALIGELEARYWALRVGVVEDQDLPAVYSAATVFCLPSLMEGFGFPVAEAMACGCPVVCSNQASLPEVAGDAAVLVNPRVVEDIAGGLDLVLSNHALRHDLRAKGFRQAAKFTWAETARQTEAVYRELLGGK